MTAAKVASRNEAIERLRASLAPGDTVHTVLRHVSASGMTRDIDALQLTSEPDGRIITHWLSGLACRALGWPRHNDAVRVSGVGMDMGFHLVYSLSRALFPAGFDCTGKRCPSNDHSNGDRDYTPHNHRDGGYALRHAWL